MKRALVLACVLMLAVCLLASAYAAAPKGGYVLLESMKTVPAMSAGKSAFLVTGDSSRNKEMCLPGGGFATVKIQLPKAWDKLMAERGYEPLDKFRLSSSKYH